MIIGRVSRTLKVAIRGYNRGLVALYVKKDERRRPRGDDPAADQNQINPEKTFLTTVPRRVPEAGNPHKLRKERETYNSLAEINSNHQISRAEK